MTTRLIFSYGMLAMTAVVVLAYDSAERADTAMDPAPKPSMRRTEAAAYAPIMPLAQSPFREARVGSNSLARNSQAAENTDENSPPAHVHKSALLFLKVPLQTDMDGNAVSLERGTAVELVKKKGGKLIVRHESFKFMVETWQVTDDRTKLAGLARTSS